MNKVHKSTYVLVLYQNKSDLKIHTKDRSKEYDLFKLIQNEMLQIFLWFKYVSIPICAKIT